MCLVARLCSAMPSSDVVWCLYMSRYDLDLVSYTEDLLSKIKISNRSNYLTHKTLKRKKKLNQVLWLAALGLGAAAGWIRGRRAGHGAYWRRGGLLRCRSGRGRRRGGGVGVEEAVAVQIGAATTTADGRRHGSLRRRRWLDSVVA
jgi:hypothetical protein